MKKILAIALAIGIAALFGPQQLAAQVMVEGLPPTKGPIPRFGVPSVGRVSPEGREIDQDRPVNAPDSEIEGSEPSDTQTEEGTNDQPADDSDGGQPPDQVTPAPAP